VQADPQRRASFVVHSAIASFYHKSFPALGSASQGVSLLKNQFMRTCAYCGKSETLTREHVTPNFIYKYLKINGMHTGWNNRIETYKNNLENKIKDVCAECNNDNLSELDAYGKEFIDRNYLYKQQYLKQVSLTYEYHNLSRWLLKILYNSSRLSQYQNVNFKYFLSYILSGENQPDIRYLGIIVVVLKPKRHFKNEKLPCKPFLVNGKIYTNPFQFRIFNIPAFNNLDCSIKCVSIGGIQFHVVFVSRNKLVGHASSVIKKYAKLYKNSYILQPNKKYVTIKVTDITWVDSLFSSPDFVERLEKYEPK